MNAIRGLSLLLAFLTGLAVFAPSAPAHAQDDMEDVSVFYEELEPYGEWVAVADYGYVWRPVGLWTGWRPYTYGEWVYTEYGWTWVSHFSWGWAPFHYGRWVLTDTHGWVWIPGTTWAPAWVVWRTSDTVIGWAPMGPTFVVGVTVGPAWGWGWGSWGWWTFMGWGHFGGVVIRERCLPPARIREVWPQTQQTVRAREVRGHQYYPGPSRERVEQSSGRSVHEFRVRDAGSAGQMSKGGGEAGTVAMYRPKFRAEKDLVNVQSLPERFRQQSPEFRGYTPNARSFLNSSPIAAPLPSAASSTLQAPGVPAAPLQPQTPQFNAPQSPVFNAPATPSFQAPQQPSFQAPGSSQFAPAPRGGDFQAPAYTAPQPFVPRTMTVPRNDWGQPKWNGPAPNLGQPRQFDNSQAPAFRRNPGWTDPSPQPDYNAPRYQSPDLDAPRMPRAPAYQYQPRQYEAPRAPSVQPRQPAYEYKAPSHDVPRAAPRYDSPRPATPSWQAPSYQAPIQRSPSFQAPSYRAPSYNAPGFQPRTPSYTPPSGSPQSPAPRRRQNWGK
ncbi:MAG: hypothetical protein GMKNLPBB_01922 [Myxococcota bacterium]|nr:hypothetical protein [Myxococcota bacterium]